MSALGHKQTFAVQNGMSALPPIADICSAQAHVRFVPIADILNASIMGYPCRVTLGAQSLLDFRVVRRN